MRASRSFHVIEITQVITWMVDQKIMIPLVSLLESVIPSG